MQEIFRTNLKGMQTPENFASSIALRSIDHIVEQDMKLCNCLITVCLQRQISLTAKGEHADVRSSISFSWQPLLRPKLFPLVPGWTVPSCMTNVVVNCTRL
jgi:hypothetical protein